MEKVVYSIKKKKIKNWLWKLRIFNKKYNIYRLFFYFLKVFFLEDDFDTWNRTRHFFKEDKKNLQSTLMEFLWKFASFLE